MKIVNRKISELNPAVYNARRMNEKEFEDLKTSIKRLEVLQPAVININPERKDIIIGGHQRIKAAEALGLTEYPCLEVNFDEKKEREANIRMNKTGGRFDLRLLKKNFQMPDLKNWGFKDIELMPKKAKEVKFTIKPKMVKCPSCGDEFDSKKHRVK